MNIDGLTIAALAAELEERLLGSRVQGIFHPQPTVITLELWAGQEKRVLIEAGEIPRVQLTRQEFAHPQRPSAFCMLLRKYLKNGVLWRVAQVGLERVLDLYIRHGDDYILRAELLGKHANIILLRGDTILGALWASVGGRSFRPGEVYHAPPSQGKLDPRSITEEEFCAQLLSHETTVVQALLKTLDGIGPRLAKELCVRAQLDPTQPVTTISAEHRTALWSATRQLFESIFTKQVHPCLYLDGETPVDVAPLPLKLYEGMRSQSSPTLSDALDAYVRLAPQQSSLVGEQHQLQQIIRSHREKLRRAVERVAQDLEKAHNCEQLRHEGDLLLANLHKLHKGLGEIEVEDFLDGTRKIIKLDPALEPIENAQQRFERYKKLKRAREKLMARLEELERAMRSLEEAESHLQQAQSAGDLAKIREDFGAAGYLPPERRERLVERASGPREFVIGGYRVWVGRSSKQNDELLRRAAREDYWLHARDRPGSHVIVKNPHAREIPFEVLQQAAQLAAYYSKGRDAKKVPVSYTRVKYLRKGGRAGLVMMTQEEGTLLVVPKGEP